MTYITDFLQGENVSTALIPAIKAALTSDKILCFPEREYHFYPEGCSGRYGPKWQSLPDFPSSRIVSDDYPILRFYPIAFPFLRSFTHLPAD